MNMKPEFSELIKTLKQLAKRNAKEITIKNEIIPIVKELAVSSNWLEKKYFYVGNDANGFNGHKIYVESDQTLAVYVTAWLPHCSAPPHNHGTWAISAGVVSSETHTFWKRIDDGNKPNYAMIVEQDQFVCSPGKVIFMESEQIHSVMNESEETSLSLQIYGKHPNYTDRIQINPITHETCSFIGKETE